VSEDSDEVVVTVEDTIPPEITVSVHPMLQATRLRHPSEMTVPSNP
jgi:hypothetical protein